MVTDIRSRTVDTETLPSGSGRLPDPLGALRRWWIWGALACVLVTAAGSAWAWKKGQPHFRTEGVLYVSPRFVRNLEVDQENDLQSNSQYREFVQQQVRTINRYDIMLAVVSDGSAVAKAWLKKGETPRRAAERLRDALQISPVPDTYQVTIGIEGDKKEGIAELVNAVMDRFVTTARTEMIYDRETRLRNLVDERGKVQTQIADLIEQRTQIAQLLGTTLFSNGAKNSFEAQAGDSSTALMTARHERLSAEAALGTSDTTGAVQEGMRAAAFDQAMKDSGLGGLRSALNQKKADLMLRMSGLSPQHPGRIALEKDVAAIEREIESATAKVQNKGLQTMQEIQRGKLAQNSQLEGKLEGEQRKMQEQAAAYSRAYQRSIELGEDIDRLRKRLNATEDRASFLELENKAPGFIRVFSPALPPDMPLGGGLKKLLLMVLMAAFVIGCVVMVGLDLLDPRVRSTREMTALLRLPVTAWAPQCTGGLEQADSPQILRIAVMLRRHLEEFQGRSLVITGLRHGAGSSSMALSLGRALEGIGVHTLVAEVNALTPDPRYLGSKPRPGFAAAANGSADLADCIEPATRTLPDRIAVGAAATEYELIAGEPITDILKHAAYDLVLVDAPPLPLSLLTEELIRQVGSTLLVVSAGDDRRAEVRESLATIERLQPRAFGAILNRAAA